MDLSRFSRDRKVEYLPQLSVKDSFIFLVSILIGVLDLLEMAKLARELTLAVEFLCSITAKAVVTQNLTNFW